MAQLPLQQGWPRAVQPSQVQGGRIGRGSRLAQCSAATALKLFTMFAQGAPQFHHVLGLANLQSESGSDPGGSRAVWAQAHLL